MDLRCHDSFDGHALSSKSLLRPFNTRSQRSEPALANILQRKNAIRISLYVPSANYVSSCTSSEPPWEEYEQEVKVRISICCCEESDSPALSMMVTYDCSHSQTFTVLSMLAEAKWVPLGDQATLSTALV